MLREKDAPFWARQAPPAVATASCQCLPMLGLLSWPIGAQEAEGMLVLNFGIMGERRKGAVWPPLAPWTASTLKNAGVGG